MKKNVMSMTGYGRGEATSSAGRFVIEIQSLNRRHLEVSLQFPRPLLRFELPARKHVAEHVARGGVSVSLTWQKEPEAAVNVVPNLALAKGIKAAWEQVAKETQISGGVTLEMLARERELLQLDELGSAPEAIEAGIEEALTAALKTLNAVRAQEGAALADELSSRLKALEMTLAKIEKLSENAPRRYREKLRERLQEFAESADEDERILKEIALFAEKVDITEECVRLKSHLELFADTLKEAGPKGKRLDFLLQEMGREFNTIGSKSSDVEIAHLVVGGKSDLEKMREQGQNIE